MRFLALINKVNCQRNIFRLLRYHFVVPILRFRGEKKQLARGVMVGLFIGLTPTVGIQMMVILLAWLVLTKFIGWKFPLPVAIAWSWVSNPITMGPIYFLFYFVGSFLMGQELNNIEFDSFKSSLIGAEAVAGLIPLWVKGVGYSIALGSLFCATIISLLGYIAIRWGVIIITTIKSKLFL